MESFTPISLHKSSPKLAKAVATRRFRLVLATAIAVFLILALFRTHQDLSAFTNSQGQYAPILSSTETKLADSTDWSKFAYIQYATNSEYLCNSIMLFESLHQLGSRPDRVLMYPSGMIDPEASEANTHDAKLLIKARDEFNVRLSPIIVQHRDGADRWLPISH